MKCLKCGTESKWELCRKCKEEKHRAWAIISQNKKKLKNLLNENILELENYNKFILYTDNIRKRGEIYMTFVAQKHYTIFKIISGTIMLASIFISLYSISSLVILYI
jgi:hypothetical protein